jgi:membrane protein DedA with SNARE-associated domain
MLKVGNLTIKPAAVYRMGSWLIWVGVLTWAPFILLRILGEKPSLFWFLPLHLLGVVGGSRLRGLARREMETAPEKNTLRMIGHALIWLGVGVWIPYFFLKYVSHQPVEVMRFLPFHLTGVLGGVVVLGYLFIKKQVGNKAK